MYTFLSLLMTLIILDNCNATEIYTNSGDSEYYKKNIKINSNGSLELSDELRDILVQNTKIVENNLNLKNGADRKIIKKKRQIIKFIDRNN